MKNRSFLITSFLWGFSYLSAATPLPVAPVTPPPSAKAPIVTPQVAPPQIVTSPVVTPVLAPVEKPIDWDRILNLWFGPLGGADYYPAALATTWFAFTPENAAKMREYYDIDVLKAMRGEYNHWRENPRGRLALILLLDQVPRLMYGSKPKAYVSDRMAQGLVIEGIQKQDDMKLYPVERAFFYMPLMHSEDPKLQNISMAKYQILVNDAPDLIKGQMQEFLTYAQIHQDVINRFGRFPIRNAISDRQTTPEEAAYIKEWGSYPN